MDAKNLGRFIAQLRREQNMTQLDLAHKLQVTDKAVSKWERGLGLPDINTLEPLADALGISIVELMRAERIQGSPVSQQEASDAVSETIDLVKHHRRQERKQLLWIGGSVLAVAGFTWLLDALGWFALLFVFFPWVCGILAVVLTTIGILRVVRKMPCVQTFVWAGVCAAIAAAPLVLVIVGFALGLGPIPN